MSERPIGQREDSLWESSAVPPTPFAPLQGTGEAEVGIIGGGFTGLATAFHLQKRGSSAVVLDAAPIGWGSSGRNGGFVSSAWRVSLREVLASYGAESAERMYRLGIEAVEGLGRICEELGLDSAGFRRCGHVTGAATPAGLARLKAKAEFLHAQFGDTSHHVLDRQAATEIIGSSIFHGGLLADVEGAVHPLNLVRGLADRVVQAGGAIHESSRVTNMRPDGGAYVLTTPRGELRVRRVVLATDAYSNIASPTQSLARGIIPFESAAISTEPLPAALLSRILSGGHVGSDSKRVLRWFRVVEQRLVFGGRGAFRPGGGAHTKFARLQRNMIEMFPETDGLRIEHRWSGRVGMTADLMAHVGCKDDVFYALGYNGTGVALSLELGRMVAAMILGEKTDLGPLGRPLPALPLPTVSRMVARGVAGWYQLLDALRV